MTDAIAIRVGDFNDWYQVPHRYDVMWIASGKPLPHYELIWQSYMTTVRDLCLAGF